MSSSDISVLTSISDKNIITLEENAEIGGFGSEVLRFYSQNGITSKVSVLGVKDAFVNHASVDKQLEQNGLTVSSVKNKLI